MRRIQRITPGENTKIDAPKPPPSRRCHWLHNQAGDYIISPKIGSIHDRRVCVSETSPESLHAPVLRVFAGQKDLHFCTYRTEVRSKNLLYASSDSGA